MSDCILNLRIFPWHLQFLRSSRTWRWAFNDYHWKRGRRLKTCLIPIEFMELHLLELVKP